MPDRALHSIQEAQRVLGGISRRTICHLLRIGHLGSVQIGSRQKPPDQKTSPVFPRTAPFATESPEVRTKAMRIRPSKRMHVQPLSGRTVYGWKLE